jgi:hypothetical protein
VLIGFFWGLGSFKKSHPVNAAENAAFTLRRWSRFQGSMPYLADELIRYLQAPGAQVFVVAMLAGGCLVFPHQIGFQFARDSMSQGLVVTLAERPCPQGKIQAQVKHPHFIVTRSLWSRTALNAGRATAKPDKQGIFFRHHLGLPMDEILSKQIVGYRAAIA